MSIQNTHGRNGNDAGEYSIEYNVIYIEYQFVTADGFQMIVICNINCCLCYYENDSFVKGNILEMFVVIIILVCYTP